MSCEIQAFAIFEDLEKFFQKSTPAQNESEINEKNSFLEFQIAISPTREILVFAKSSWLLICRAKWDSNIKEGPKIKYNPLQHGHLQCEPGEKVTSLLCLPFFSPEQRNHDADWTCIVVGFSSGCIRFYTESMQELAKSNIHPESVNKIKPYCPFSIQQKKASKHDINDIYVVCETVICVFNGPNLYQILLSRKNQLDQDTTQSINQIEFDILNNFKKYSFVHQEVVTDACYLGQTFVSSHTTFDHLVTASFADGFNSNYRTSSPQMSLIITSGKKPFIGFHYTFESSSSPILADVAYAIANKIKSSVTANLTDWFGFGNKKSINQEKSREIANDQAEKLNCRFGLCDLRREGLSINCSPNGLFSAISDSLGRVILIENSTGIALQLWKGFRDAQCGFIQVQDITLKRHNLDKESRGSKRVALFILIYAPRKGLIEIFCTHNGRKVSSFEVTKFGRLIYDPRSCNILTSAEKFRSSHGQVIFISEEGLTEFLVPFHCFLSENGDKISRDLHVLKKIKSLLKTDWESLKFVEEMEKCAKELKMDETRCQAIEILAGDRNTTLQAFKAVLSIFIQDIGSSDNSDYASKSTSIYAEVIYNLLSFYEFLKKINEVAIENSEMKNNSLEIDVSSLFEKMKITEKELNSVLLFINQVKKIEELNKSNVKVTFDEKKDLHFGEFLSSFDLKAFLTNLKKDEKLQNTKTINHFDRLNLKKNNQETNLAIIGEYLFKGILFSSVSLSEWSAFAVSCRLEPTDLAFSLISHWCNKIDFDDFSEKEIDSFIEILKTICLLNDPNEVTFEYNTESPWWSGIRNYIASNPVTIRGLFAGLCCRSVTIFMEEEREHTYKKNNEKQKSNDGVVIREWESLSKDTYEWDIFISQIQDVALLNAVLSLNLKESQIPGPFPRIDFDFERQCLNSLQLKGMGRVSELVARWLIQYGLDPSKLINITDTEFQGNEEKIMEADNFLPFKNIEESNEKVEEKKLSPALDYLLLLKSRFPYSLTTSSLLINFCWEYMTYWNKNASDMKYLDAAVQYLKIVPSNKIKYGMSFLSWSTYLQQKVKSLSFMINRVGKAPKDKLCIQEIGISSSQVPHFLKIVSDYLIMLLQSKAEENVDFFIHREAIWQNCPANASSNLMSIALSQPLVNHHLITLLLQLVTTLLLMSSLNIKVVKVFSTFWDNMDPSFFSIIGEVPLPSNRQDHIIKNARRQFLQKSISAAIQTIELVECIQRPPDVPGGDQIDIPSTKFNVQEYKKWLQVIFELAEGWDVTFDDLRRHQVCELYNNGLDRLAEEVLPTVNEKELLASQLLVIAGKRLKHFIEDSKNVSDQFSNLSFNLSEWLKSLDMENFTYQNETVDDIEVMLRYVINYFPEDHSNQNLAIAIIESLSFFRTSQ